MYRTLVSPGKSDLELLGIFIELGSESVCYWETHVVARSPLL